mgnify:CR=1 FL=1
MEITIKIDERKKEAKALVEFLKNLSFVEISSEKRYNKETEKVIYDAKKGIGLTRYKDSKEMFEKILG